VTLLKQDAIETLEDVDLVGRAIAGQQECFSELVERYEFKVRGYCYHMLSQSEMAEDAAQDIFIKAFRSMKSFRGESSFSTWLFRIATNHCFDLNRKSRLRSVFLGHQRQEVEINCSSNLTNVGQERDVIARQAIRNLLLELPAKDRSLIVLREWQGLTYQELMQVFKCSEDSIKSRLKRVRSKIVKLQKAAEEQSRKEVVV